LMRSRHSAVCRSIASVTKAGDSGGSTVICERAGVLVTALAAWFGVEASEASESSLRGKVSKTVAKAARAYPSYRESRPGDNATDKELERT
jgi:hypothetical protein